MDLASHRTAAELVRTTYRPVVAWTTVSAALGAALVWAPARLAARGDSDLSDRHVLVEDLRSAFVAYWRSGAREYPPELARLVDYWTRYNVLKSVICAALLVALVALGRQLWRTSFPCDTSRPSARAAVAAVGTAVWGCALAVLWMLIAGVQGVAAPFGALLPVLRQGGPDPALSDTFDEIQRQLDHVVTTGAPLRPPVEAMVDSYARFHIVHAVAAAPTALVLLVAAVALWRPPRRAQGDARSTRTRRSAAAACALIALMFGVICAANVATAANPEPGLIGFFEGGW